MNTPGPTGNTGLSRLLGRWGWVVALEALVLLCLWFDWLPKLRGYAPWPPEWQWKHIPGTNMIALIPGLVAGTVIALAGWMMDRVHCGIRRRLYAAVILLGSVALQVSLVWVRGPELNLHLSQRTTVDFLEDYATAARQIDSPFEAFTRYDELAARNGQLRVATHPPGMIFIYRIFEGPRIPHAKPEGQGTLPATALKLSGGILALAGVWLLARAFARKDEPGFAGRAMALTALVPAVALFTASVDQLIMGLSTFALGSFIYSLRSDRYTFWAALAGIAVFLQSAIAYQVVTTLFLIAVASALFAIKATRKPRELARLLGVRIALLLGIPAMIWAMILSASDFNYLARLIDGIGAHNKGPIHANRSRAPWLLWNLWDVVFFLGLGWAALWLRRATWRPLLGNPLIVALALMWTMVMIGDGVRGETARIMLFTFPILAMALLVPNRKILDREDYGILAGLLLIQTLVFAAVLHLF